MILPPEITLGLSFSRTKAVSDPLEASSSLTCLIVVSAGYSREKSGEPEEKMKRIFSVVGGLLDPEAVVASSGVLIFLLVISRADERYLIEAS